MNQSIKKLFTRITRVGPAALALAALWVATAPLNAEASFSAGNTIIRNTITVNYSDARSIAQTAVTSTVDITVNTVAAAPTIVSVVTSPGTTDATGAQVTYTFKIRTNSNGPGVISFASADGNLTNVAAGTPPTVPASIFLGSTVIDPTDTHLGTPQTVANLASITFAVPNDGGLPTDAAVSGGGFGDYVINGLKNGDIVWIYSGTTYYGPFTVGTVTDPTAVGGTTAAPGSVQLINNGASIGPFTPAYGWQIVESKDVTVTVTQGNVTNPLLAASWDTTLTATMGGLNTNTPIATTNAHMGRIAISKFVRNVTTPMVGGSSYTPPVTINGASNTFYATGVTGKPGEILEYLAVVNDAGTGDSKFVTATDPVPTYSTLVTFPTTYGTSQGSGSGIFAHARFLASEIDLKSDNSVVGTNVAFGKTSGVPPAAGTLTFYLATGCTNSAGGTIATTQTAYVIYQVKID